MKKPIWILVAVVTLTVAAFSIALYNHTQQGRYRSSLRRWDPPPYRARPIEIRSTRPVPPEELAAMDPMTGIIAGRVEGTDEIRDVAVCYFSVTTGYNSQASMPVIYEGRRFRAERLPKGTYRVRTGGGHAEQTVRLGPGEVVDDIVLRKKNTEGPSPNEAKDTAPSPPNIRVIRGRFEMLDESLPPARASIVSFRASGHAEADGSFSIETRETRSLKELLKRIHPKLIAPGYEMERTWTGPSAPSAGQVAGATNAMVTTQLVIGLRRAPLVSGRVLSPTGQPLPGAHVAVMPHPRRTDRSNQAEQAVCGKNGEFMLTARTRAASKTTGVRGLPLGAERTTVLSVWHPLFATCVYSATGIESGTGVDVGDLAVLPGRRVQLKITYGNPKQKKHWQLHKKERFEAPVQRREYVSYEESSIPVYRPYSPDEDSIFPAGPFTTIEWWLTCPGGNVLDSFKRLSPWYEQEPRGWDKREALPETVELSFPALPLRRFRIVDRDGEPAGNARFRITFVPTFLGFWRNLIPKKFRPPRYASIVSHANMPTGASGEAEYLIPEGVPMVVEVIPESPGRRLPFARATPGGFETLPKNSFVPRSGEDIGDLVLSATVSPGTWNAMPQ